MGIFHKESRIAQSGNPGFTLIELSIVLIIFGILVSAIVRAIKTYQNRERQNTSVERVAEASQLLADFVSRFDGPDANTSPDNRLPCPSNPTLGLGQAEFGNEQCPPRSAGPGTVFKGVRVAVNPKGQKIYIGGLPTATMTEEGSAAFDGHNSALVYAVTATLTEAGSITGSNPVGGIQVNVDGGGVRTNAPFIVASTGRNGWGASGTGPTGDGENIDGDHIFNAYTGHSTIVGANYYDDEVVFKLGDIVSCMPNKIDVQRFTSDGTWTKPAGFVYADVTVNGAGGGAANCTSTSTCGFGDSSCWAEIGGGGGVARGLFDNGEIPDTVDVVVGRGGSSACDEGYKGHGPCKAGFETKVLGGVKRTIYYEGKDGSPTSFGSYVVVSGGKGAKISNSSPYTKSGLHGTQVGADDFVENSSTESRTREIGRGGGCGDGTDWTEISQVGGTGADGSVIVTSYLCE